MKRIIDIKQLKHVTRRSNGGQVVTIAQCPACAEAGYDLTGRNHLIVYPSGAFSCVVNTGEAGADHRREILDLVGIPVDPLPLPCGQRAKKQRPSPLRPLPRIPTKITYIQLNPKPTLREPPQPQAEPSDAV